MPIDWQQKKRSLGQVSEDLQGYGLGTFGLGTYGIGEVQTVVTDLAPIWNVKNETSPFMTKTKEAWQEKK